MDPGKGIVLGVVAGLSGDIAEGCVAVLGYACYGGGDDSRRMGEIGDGRHTQHRGLDLNTMSRVAVELSSWRHSQRNARSLGFV